jgi:hypothetical protein
MFGQAVRPGVPEPVLVSLAVVETEPYVPGVGVGRGRGRCGGGGDGGDTFVMGAAPATTAGGEQYEGRARGDDDQQGSDGAVAEGREGGGHAVNVPSTYEDPVSVR